MPREGWKTIALDDDMYAEVKFVADSLDRSINWTANRMISFVLAQVIDGDGPNTRFNPKAAEEYDLR